MITRPSTTSAFAKAIVISETNQLGASHGAVAAARKAMPPRRMERHCMSELPRLRPGEQTIRAEDQHQRHHAVDDEELDLRRKVHRRGAGDADDEGADERTLDRAHAA